MASNALICKDFFIASTTDTADFTTKHEATFLGVNIIISNDSSNVLSYSFNGTDIHGTLLANETLEFRDHTAKMIYVKSAEGGDAFRCWIW